MIALVLKDEAGGLFFFVYEPLEDIVADEGDLAYLKSLFLDFRGRAEVDPESLFKQISSLGFGPLVTRDFGRTIFLSLEGQQASESVEAH